MLSVGNVKAKETFEASVPSSITRPTAESSDKETGAALPQNMPVGSLASMSPVQSFRSLAHFVVSLAEKWI